MTGQALYPSGRRLTGRELDRLLAYADAHPGCELAVTVTARTSHVHLRDPGAAA